MLLGRRPIETVKMGKTKGGVAQLGEHYVRNVGVGGSNPLTSTIFSHGYFN